ncbi:hypothetical protein BDV97DRAFT_104216 [Delphinella strobiligena]|nr:hypothetical protein BDV97DRAFT_104216 [Delphinella strobiligena]
MGIENSPEEDTVKSWGFSLVSTNKFGPWAELPKHSHTDPNTHLIVSGSMIMTDYGVDGHSCVQQSTGLRPRDRYDVPAHVSYGGWAGPEGVVFVEGRKNLSAGLKRRMEGLDTPADLERPYVPVRWNGARAKVVEYESRGFTPGNWFNRGDSSTSGFSLNSVSNSSTSGFSRNSVSSSSTSGFSLNSVSRAPLLDSVSAQ